MLALATMPGRKSAEETSDARNNLTISLEPPEMNRHINLACDRLRLNKRMLARTVLEWFAYAPESVQQVVVSRVPSDLREVYKKKITEYFSQQLGDNGVDLKISQAAKDKGPRGPRE